MTRNNSITGLVVGNGQLATASTFSWSEGNFGSSLALSLWGNYEFGANFIDESTVTWGPGTSTARTLGGDDTRSYPQQDIRFYNYFATASWDGTTLVIGNIGSKALGAQYQWTLSTMQAPIPAAAWLFGGALGVLGWIRRRQAKA